MPTLTLNVPEPLYQHLRRRAQRNNRTVEAETVDLLATVIPGADELPTDLAESLSVLDDEALWRAARSHLATEAATQLEELHRKRQREGLSEAEAQRLRALVRQYERGMLVRAQAAALLRQRGHDVSGLVDKP
jgi:plasmid stability protein